MKINLKKTAVALSITQLLCAGNALSAENSENEMSSDIEVIEVKGFGATLGKALREKRYSQSVVEIISSDDLGTLPDVSITDSLVRLPGIAASRDRGNASRISIRGMGPRLNVATMNNREIVSAEPSRDVRFEQFPAELIDSVEVYKSPIASKAEGGIAGLVNMNFVSPLSKDKRIINIGASMMKNQLGDDLPGTDGKGYKANFSIVDQVSDSFGYAFGLTYQDQPSLERGIESWDYNNAADRGDLNDNQILEDAPWGMMVKSKRGENERTGGLLILEWQPSDRLSIKTDLFYSQFDIRELDDQMGAGDLGNWQNGGSDAYKDSAVEPVIVTKANSEEHLVAGSQKNNGLDVSTPTWFQTNEMLSAGVNVEYVGDVWTTKLDVGFSEASIESVWVDVNPVYVGGDYDLGFDIQDPQTPKLIVHSGDISSPENYSLGVVQSVDNWVETSPGVWENLPVETYVGATMEGNNDRVLSDEMYNINLDFSRDLDLGIFSQLSFGARITDRNKENDEINTWVRTAKQDHGLTNYGTSYSIGGGYHAPDIYTFNNWNLVANQAFGGATNPADNRSDKNSLASWLLEETNTAAYAMLNMVGDIGDIPFSGNIGIRYAKTEVTSTGHQNEGGFWTQDQDGNWYEVPLVVAPVSIDHDYSEFLPSFNMILNLTEDSQVRIGAARTMSRPPLLEMRTGYTIDPTTQPPSASGGNPKLDPYIADQFDIGYEYYWGESSAATINFFYKDLKSHIGIDSGTINVGDDSYAFTGTVNGDGGVIKGFEVLYQQSFDMLPAPFDGMGIFANYSYTDSGVQEFKPDNNPYNLGGLSKDIASATLWYDKDGFDARVSVNYRSEYTGINSWTPSKVNLNSSETTADASVGYFVTDNLKVTLQAQNLTNEKSVTYWDNDYSKPAFNVEWGRRYLIGFQYTL
ncbi:TonB-dependent receptor [Catenovulum sediminis]|uniref:TonB-dependent receptor n=1 Tax=Catenovulum sediminis TaxID=1740262 RepID=A0ABV1RJJ3_9ALTE